jgi:hypothetical protein
MTTATAPEVIADANSRLLDEIIQAPSDSPLHRGLSLIARNRVAVGLARGLDSLSYGDGDSVEDIKAALKAAGEWILRVADQAE